MVEKLRKFYRLIVGLMRKGGKRVIINSDSVESCKFFNMLNRHVFFGYYDLAQISADGRKMLVTVVGKDANPDADKAEIGYYDLADGEYHRVGETGAWCWQQGARLRWHPIEPNTILYNNIYDGNCVTEAVNLDTGESRVVAPALYDISGDFRYGVSVNFARLQRLRPGYGYDNGKLKKRRTDALENGKLGVEDGRASENDGVFLVDLSDGSVKLIVSLCELAQGSDRDLECEHYINHVCFCPDGKKFIFLHIAKTGKKGFNRIIELYLYDIGTGELRLIESDWATSHYCWRSADELLTTKRKEGIRVYSIYDLSAKTNRIIEHAGLRVDGHPSFCGDKNKFITDTRPDKYNYQRLFMFDMAKGDDEFLAEFFHKPPKSSDMRCDLHPRLWEKDGKQIITLDTTCKGGLRQAALLERKDR